MGAAEVLEVLYVAVHLSGSVWSCLPPPTLPSPIPLASEKLIGGAEAIHPRSQYRSAQLKFPETASCVVGQEPVLRRIEWGGGQKAAAVLKQSG